VRVINGEETLEASVGVSGQGLHSFPPRGESSGFEGRSKRSVLHIVEDQENSEQHKRIRELEELNQPAQRISSTLEVEETLAAIVSCSMSLSNVDRGVIALFYPKTGGDVHTITRHSASSQNPIDHVAEVVFRVFASIPSNHLHISERV
jgi:hypothetical protein